MAEYFAINKKIREADSVKQVLVAGLTCIDIFNMCEDFPKEDEDVNVTSQFWSVGGNAANTSRTLSQHPNVRVDLFSGLSNQPENAFVLTDLKSYGVNTERCQIYKDKILPTSCCIINNSNGSRTIMHCNHDFPKLDYNDFQDIDTNSYNLIHFEGRDLDDVSRMLDHILSRRNSKVRPLVSAEMEKPKRLDAMEKSFQGKVDVLFVSKDVGKAKGFKNALETVDYYAQQEFSSTAIICPWGEAGAAFAEKNNNGWKSEHIPSFHVELPIDTLGAGDVFIAGTLYGVVSNNRLKDCVEYGCFLAKEKCNQIGLKDLWKGKASTT